jgi:hypothetical protein
MNKALLVGETTFQGRKAGEDTKKRQRNLITFALSRTSQVNLKEMVRLCILLLTLTRRCKQQINRFYVIPPGATY